jgi:hypothetical protein
MMRRVRNVRPSVCLRVRYGLGNKQAVVYGCWAVLIDGSDSFLLWEL